MRLAVLYEHPEWFRPLFAALLRRALPFERVDAARLAWDPAAPPDFSLLVNRMSPSAGLRGHGHALQATGAFLDYAESHGIPVVNGSRAWRLETSKSAQIDLLERLGIPYPRTRVINHPQAAPAAARGLDFPVLVKPNVGGSGAGIMRFDTPEALASAAAGGRLDLGPDGTTLVQELLPARGGAITRLELLGTRVLYAIRIRPPAGHGFNLCPADICRDEGRGGEAALEAGCATRPAMQIEATGVDTHTLDQARAIVEAAGLDVCGIELLTDERDGRSYVYDINALSNFVTDAPRVVGFDPFEDLVDELERRLRARERLVRGAAAYA